MPDILKKIISFIEEKKIIVNGDSILVGVSGGPDSVFLLDFLFHYQEKKHIFIKVAYIHHHLRKSADKELLFVKQLAEKKYKLPFYSSHILIKNKKSIEEQARIKRYNELKKLAIKTGCNKIAVGHTLDDQSETVLMRILRGSGMKGLCGITPISKLTDNVQIIRPLLNIKKDEIKEYLKKNCLKYKIDKSNFSLKFLRNRIRNETFPLLEKINPKIKEQLAKTSFLLQDDFDFLQKTSLEKYKKICIEENGKIYLDKKKFTNLHVSIKRMIISGIVEKLTGSPYKNYYLIEEIRDKIENKKTIFIQKFNLYINIDKEKIIFSKERPKKSIYFPKIIKKIVPFSKKIFKNKNRFVAYFDFDKLKGNLKVRKWKRKDFFQPLGMKEAKKISRFFIDKKIPKEEREKIPVLVSGKEIVWVIGIEISEKFKVEKNTKKVLKVEALISKYAM